MLFVEDEPLLREVGALTLTRCGYTALVASNGEDAIRIVQEEFNGVIDLLLTDMIMPLMSGKDLANRLTSIHPETKVLYTSGYADDAFGQRGILDRSTNFIQKPYTPAALARKVRDVLDT